MKPFKVVSPFEPAGVPHVARATLYNNFLAVLPPGPAIRGQPR